MEFNKDESAVAAALVKSSKSAEQLSEELGMPEEKVEEVLAKLAGAGVARNSNGRYSLIPQVRRGVMGKEDEEEKLTFKAHAILEGQSKDKEVLSRANQVLIANLKKDKLVKPCNLVEEEIVQEGDTYYVMFECDIYAKSLEDLLYFVIRYGPSSLEMEKPDKFELGRHEAQGMLMDVATTIHSYMALIQQMKKDQEIVIK